MFRRYAFTCCYLGLYVLMEFVQELAGPSGRAALDEWASTSVANLEHHPVSCLIVSAFVGGGGRVTWPVLIAAALLAANHAVGNVRTLVGCLLGQVVGSLVSEGIVAYRVDAGTLPVSSRHLVDIGPSYVVMAAVVLALVGGGWAPRLVATVVLALLVFVGDIFSGLSSLDVAAVGHLTAAVTALGLAVVMRIRGTSGRRLPGDCPNRTAPGRACRRCWPRASRRPSA